MRKKIIAANWKMNGRKAQALELAQQLKTLEPHNVQVVIMPPAIYVPLLNDLLQGTSLILGGQNIYPEDAGAFTGELSAPMLKEYGCAYVLVGHSERRRLFHEDAQWVIEKFHHVKEHGMIPILCVGETLLEREQGRTQEVIEHQLMPLGAVDPCYFSDCVIAYEPVWAIGTGQAASAEQAQEVHAFIRNLVAQVSTQAAEHLSILYGGSVNEHNAKALFSMPDIDGGLIGGASLHAAQFMEIVTCINS